MAGACRCGIARGTVEIIFCVRTTAARAALAMVTVALTATGLLTGCSAVLDQVGVVAPGLATGAGVEASGAKASGDAAAALGKLAVKGRAPKTGYSRDQFGVAWADVDHNGCDTRDDVLKRDMTKETFKPGTHDCVVLTGALADPYTAKTIAFTRGNGTSEAVQIDHMVALSDAWQKGAQQLDAATRQNLANDPLNLMAVDGPTNQAKGDSDAATWLPPNKAFRCRYVARQVAVKSKYHLYVTKAEHDAITGVLGGCPGEPLPTDRTLPAPK